MLIILICFMAFVLWITYETGRKIGYKNGIDDAINQVDEYFDNKEKK